MKPVEYEVSEPFAEARPSGDPVELEEPDSAFISLICPSISLKRVDGWALVSDSRAPVDANTPNAHRLKASGCLRSGATTQLSGKSSNNPGSHGLNARCSSREKSAFVWLQGNHFRARRTGDGQNGDRRRGGRGSGAC